MERQNKHIVVVKLWLNDIIRLVVNEKKQKRKLARSSLTSREKTKKSKCNNKLPQKSRMHKKRIRQTFINASTPKSKLKNAQEMFFHRRARLMKKISQ